MLTGHAPDARYRGTRDVTRLKARSIDLAAIGSSTALEAADEAELVTLSDPARGRYAKLALHHDRITTGVMLGLPTAVATASQLHVCDRPLPLDRLALLLGTVSDRSGPVETPLTAAFHDGARDVAALARTTRATTGCGGCTDQVRRLCHTPAAAPEQEDAA